MKLLKPLIYTIIFLLSAVFFAAQAHAAPVYYSVGQSAANLMTGTPTVTITAGAAVFSAAQTGNIGVGDRVTYNTNQVAYISAKTNADGAHWSLVSATGGAVADITDSTVVSITREFTSLAAAVTAASNSSHINNTDLVAANVVLNLPCYYDTGADTTVVDVSGFTTSVANFIRIYTPNNTATEANNSQRHNGKWDDTKYRMYGNSYDPFLAINESYTVIDGIQLQRHTDNNPSGIAAYANYVVISNNIIKSTVAISGSNGRAIAVGWDMTGNAIYNNIIYGLGGINGIDMQNAANYAYNNTISGCYYGIRGGYVDGSILRNNIVQNSIFDYSTWWGDPWSASSSNNISEDGSAPGTNSKTNTDASFVSTLIGSEDFHLLQSDTAAKNAGADLSGDASFPFNTDIDGQTRNAAINTWDIGADESATQVFYSVGQNTNNHSSGGNVAITNGAATFSTPQTANNLGVGDVLTAGGNTYYLSSKTSTSVWNVVTNLGAIPVDLSSTAVTTIAHAFSSLSAAEAGAPTLLGTSDLVAANVQLNFPCYYDSGPDTTDVDVSGYVTSPGNYLRIYTPNDTTSETNLSQRHQGTWNASKYMLIGGAGSNNIIAIHDSFVKIDGLQIESQATDSFGGVVPYNMPSSSLMEISNNIIRRTVTGSGSWISGINLWPAGKTVNANIWNNIIYGFIWGINARGNADISNVTISNCSNVGIQIDDNLGVVPGVTVKNSLVQNSPTSFNSAEGIGASGDFNASSISNIAADATAPGANSKNSTAVSFVDAANHNFHLSPSDTAAKNSGVNLQNDAVMSFSQDIDGQERPGIWDIGADELIENQAQTQFSSPALDSGLVGHWTFDGGDVDGNVAKDVSGNGNDAAVSGGAVAPGKLGQAMNLDGTNSRMNMNSYNFTSNFTVSMWAKTNSNLQRQRLFQNGTGGATGWGVGFGGDNGTLRFTKCGIADLDIDIGGWPSDWFYVSWVVGSDNDVELFINGVSRGKYGNTQAINQGGPAIMGSDYGFPGPAYVNPWHGPIDDVRVYDRALSATEITQLYNMGDVKMNTSQNTNNASGLVGLWSFDGADVSGTTVFDRSGNGNNGTNSGALVTPGKIGQALKFNGGTDLVDIGAMTAINNVATETVAFWAKRNSVGAIVGVGKNTPSDVMNGIGLWSNGNVYFTISPIAADYAYITLNDTDWHHYTMVFDGNQTGNGNRLKVYVDGIDASPGYVNTIPALTPIANNFYVGRWGGQYSNGLVDDIRVYDRALSIGEISNLYNTGKVEIRK